MNIRNSLERLSSGFKVNKGADDPSGLAIAVYTMIPVLNGIKVATQNVEDNVNLIQTADGALQETGEILQRMRDLAVRAANQAPLNGQDRLKLQNEFVSLRDELNRKAAALTFNTKQLFTRQGAVGGLKDGGGTLIPELNKYVTSTAIDFSAQQAQVGYDNGTPWRLDIGISSMDAAALGLGAATTTVSENYAYANYNANKAFISAGYIRLVGGDGTGAGHSSQLSTGVGNAQRAITAVDSAIQRVARLRAGLGVQQRRMQHIINDMASHYINLEEAKSRILDADMAREITDFTKSQILQQSGTAILAQANAQPQSVLQLLQ